MGETWRVLMCLRTLLELVHKPKKGRYTSLNSRSKRRVAELKFLQEAIDSGEILVYVPPAMLSQVHFAIKTVYGIEAAAESVKRLLGFVVCTLDIDYDSILKRANACVYGLGDADLPDVINLACAEVLNADAFITESVADFRQIIDANYREFPEFHVQIMNMDEFIQARMRVEAQYIDDNSIYVFTPQLEKIKLPSGATPIDFAYKIHTRLGDRCTKALIKGAEVPLNKPLQNGDIVEIVKGQEDNLKQAWLDFVVTAEAKRGIQRALKRIHTASGWKIIKQSLDNNIRSYRRNLEAASLALNCSVDELAFQVGSKAISVPKLKELLNRSSSQQLPDEIEKPLSGIGERGWRLASCCKPLPGDPVIGVAGAGNRPLRIHTANCSTLQRLKPEQICSISWNSDKYTIHLQITVKNTPDIVRTILNRLAINSITPDLRSLHTSADETVRVAIVINNISRGQLDEMVTVPHPNF